LTQRGARENINDVKNEITELEQLLAAAGQTSQSTLLLKKRKEMREVDYSLENMKNQHKQRMDACEERRVQFEAKQAKMREQVLRFEKFIQENDAKRQRAESKAKAERKMFEEKLKEIGTLTERIKNLEEEQKELTDLLVKNGRYKVYLERIVEEGEFGYEEISEILNRHNTLREANADLMQHSANLEKEVDDFRRNLQSLKTEKQNQMLVSTSIVQDQQGELEKVQLHVKTQEDDKLMVENKKKDVSREMSQITQSIRNLFGRCYNTMRMKPVFAGRQDSASVSEVLDYELDIILMRISDLVEISNEYKFSGGDHEIGLNGLGTTSGTDLKEGSTGSLQTLSKSIF